MGKKSLVIIVFYISLSFAQEIINIHGKVTDNNGRPLSNAIVKLERSGLIANTGADGRFTLSTVNNHVPNEKIRRTKLAVNVNNGTIFINLLEKSLVEISCYSIQGKFVSIVKKLMNIGTYNIKQPNLANGVYLFKIRVGDYSLVVRSPYIGQIANGMISSSMKIGTDVSLDKKSSNVFLVDVISVTKDGYLNYRVNLMSPDSTNIEIMMIPSAGTMTDADGNVYQTVKIGNQVWMAENLRTTKYSDSTPILFDTSTASWLTFTAGKYCFYNNTINNDSIKKFGALYNWYALNSGKLAPTGWRVPKDEDWNTLLDYLRLNREAPLSQNKVAKSMAAQTEWSSDTSTGAIGNDLRANNRSGFSAVPGGMRLAMGDFAWIGSQCLLGSLGENTYLLEHDYHSVVWMARYEPYGRSVRLLRDSITINHM